MKPWDQVAPDAEQPAWDRVAPDDNTPALRASVHGAATIAPDRYAEAARWGREGGLPADVALRNLPEVQRRVTIERVDADTANAPKLRERYTDPNFAAVAHDDSATLAKLETYGWQQALKKGAAGAKLSLDFLADQLAGAVGADQTETRAALHETARYYAEQGHDAGLHAAGERAKAAGAGTWYGTLMNLPGEIADSGDAAGIIGRFIVEQLPASLAGFGLGVAVTAPARAAIVQRISSELVARGVNVGLASAAGNSTAVVLQSLGTNHAEGMAQGLDHEQAAERAWTKTLAEVPANAIAGAVMGLRLGPNQLTNILAQSAVQGAGGGTGAAMAAHAVGEEANPVEIALEILGEAVSTAPEVVGMTYSRIASSRALAAADAAEQAAADAQQLETLIATADESKLKQRDPDAFAKYVKELQPDTVLYIAPEHVPGYPGAAEAAAAGGDVAIPLADLLAHLPGAQLLPHLRTAPGAMTHTEAQAFDGPAALADELSRPVTAGQLLQTQPADMSADAWAEYQAQAGEAAALAIEARERRSMRDMQWLANAKTDAARTLHAEASALRAGIEAEVRAEVLQQPVYAAQRWLKTGILPDGTASVGAKLDTAALREMYGDHPASPARYIGTDMKSAEGGLHPDVVAEMFGFDSGDAMVRAIVAAEKIDSVIEGMTDQRMAEQHPDLADRVRIERAAEQAIADRARERFLATEAAALKGAIGNKTELGQKARAYAAESVARSRVGDVRPAQHKASAGRAGRNAEAAFAKGDTALAAKYKRAQVLQTALQTEATAAQSEVKTALVSFKRMAQADDSRDGNLADTARAILARYGLADSVKGDPLAKVAAYDPDLHADLLVLMEGLPDPVADHKALTVSEFRLVRDRVAAIWSLARSTRQIEVDGQMVDIKAAAAELADALAGEKQVAPVEVVGRNERLDLRMRLQGMRAGLRRVEHWADARGEAFTRIIWRPISDAVTRYRAAKAEHVGAFLQLLKQIEPTLKPGKIAAPELGTHFADRSALLHALLHTGNESNKRKLLLGYGWATDTDGVLDTTRWDAFLARMHGEGRITKADWDFVQATWDLLEKTKPAAQAAHKRMFGSYFDEVTAAPVQTPFGTYAGGYAPASTDHLQVAEGRRHGAMDDMLAGQNSPMFPAVGRGFTKGRIEDYTRPLALDLRLLPAHIDKVARFAYLGPVLRDTARLVTRQKVFTQAMNAVDPTAIESLLVPWLKRTAAQTLTKAPEGWAGRAVHGVSNTLRNRTGLLLMAGNVVNTLQQITGLSVAALKVKPVHLAAGLWELVHAPKASAEAINGLSPWMQQRSTNGAQDIEAAINELLLNPTLRQRAESAGSKYGYALQQMAQNFIDRVVWLGAFKETGDAKAADAVVRQTQGSFAPEDAAAVEHQSAFVRLFLMFFSYFSAQGNVLATEAHKAQGPARLALVYLLGFAVPAFLADVIGQGMRGELGDDEGDEGILHQLLQSFFMSQARYALAMAPVAGQVGNAILGQFTDGNRFDDRIGASPVYSALEGAARSVRHAYRWVMDDDMGNPRTVVRDALAALALMTGLPVGPLVRPLGHVMDENADSVSARGLITGSAE